MPIKRFLVFVIALLVLAQPVYAYTYLNIYIDASGNAEFFGETNETFLALPPEISTDEGKIRGITKELTQKNGELWTFSYSLRDAEIKTILPEGAVVKNLSNGEIFLERGRISLYFLDNLTVSYVIEPQSQGSLLWIPVLILALTVFAYFYRNKIRQFFKPKVIYKKPKTKPGRDKIEILRQVLNTREKMILEKLDETGKIKMSHLRRLCDIPKASFSRHVMELEKKKLLIRTGEGKNKFVEPARKI